MWNLNRQTLSVADINNEIDAAINRAHHARVEPPRLYLGASLVGDDCMRKVQFEWWCRSDVTARIRRIFDRGHFFEAYVRERLIEARFVAIPTSLCFRPVTAICKGMRTA